MLQAHVIPCELSVASDANTAWGSALCMLSRHAVPMTFTVCRKFSALTECNGLLTENRLLTFITVISWYPRVKLVCLWIVLLEYLIFQKLLFELMT